MSDGRLWRLYLKMHKKMPTLANIIKELIESIRSDGASKTENDLHFNSVYDVIDYLSEHPEIQDMGEYEKLHSKEKTASVNISKMDIGFIVPQPIKGSGGHRNIFRAVKFLHEFGHDVTVYYIQTIESPDIVKKKVSEWFYDMGDIPFIAFDGKMGYHDAGVATWWETAYMLRDNAEKIKYSFYYVQDFEPAFYPMCSNYILSENTYKMNFSHICSGKWCKDFLIEKYDAEAEYFQFPVDKSIYNTNTSRTKSNKNIIFFAKPEMDRRCYEIGIMALKKIAMMRPDIEIILFGSPHVDPNSLPFKATVMHIVPTLNDLATLYRNADLGIVFSTTNPSLVPYEMLSCGCPVVDFDLPKARSKYGGSDDGVFLFSPEPDVLAEQIVRIIDNKDLLLEKAKNGQQWVSGEFPSELDMAHRVEKMIQNKIEKGDITI